jgi:hypothetical protein
MPTITMEGEGDTVREALWNLSMNVEAAIERVEATDRDRDHREEAGER